MLHAKPALPQPKHFLMLITIGGPAPVVVSYYEGKVLTTPLQVNVGDRVAWSIRLVLGSGRVSPPYKVVFTDTRFFGVPLVSVPDGGTSGFLEVRSLKGTVSYSLHVDGIGCVFDPDIQSGSDASAAGEGSLVTPVVFDVKWETRTMPGTISYTQDGQPGVGTMKVKSGDKVTFHAVTLSGTGTGFAVTFQPNYTHLWATPFDPDNSILKAAAGTPLSTGQLKVSDPEAGETTTPVQFFCNLSLDGIAPPSPQFEIDK